MRAHRRPLAALACTAALALTAAACGSDDPAEPVGQAPTVGCAGGELPIVDGSTDLSYEAPEPVLQADCDYTAVVATNFGDIAVELDPAAAPQTVNSFVFLATRGYFDDLTFHRVVPGFVIQGGDPTGTGSGGPGYTIPDELPTAEDSYPPGTLAMANAGPDTSGSQFFIVTGDASFLPNAYTVFGRVTSGLEVAQEIEGLADPNADPGDPAAQRPTEPAIIESVRVTER